MPLTFQPYSPRERSCLGTMKHTKLETQESSDKSVSRTVTINEIEPTTPSIPTKVKNTEQESKLNELTKLVQMLIDEKVNSTQKTQESNSLSNQTESSKGDDEVELTDEESSDNDDEIAEVFRIDTNIFDYETPLCSAFNEFNYLLVTPPKSHQCSGIPLWGTTS
ncbi:hypothetical protein Tco_0324504 [Tanacetum coccineum]